MEEIDVLGLALEKMVWKIVPTRGGKLLGVAEVNMFSASDLSDTFGKSKQYWSKLMRTGKLESKSTSAGRITTTLGVIKWFNTKLESTKDDDVLEKLDKLNSKKNEEDGV